MLHSSLTTHDCVKKGTKTDDIRKIITDEDHAT